MEEKNKKYTAADFKKYHSGEMTGSKMHELEKAALEDPFLSDALEGYAFSSNIETDISQIKSRLEEKRKNRKVFSINTFAQNKWWRIAALFIIIAGAGYFFYNLDNTKENTLAKNKTEIPSITKEEIDTALTDSTVVSSGAVAFEKQEFKKDKSDSIASAPVENDKNDPYADVAKKQADQTKQPASTEYALRGKVTDDEGKALSLVTITDNVNNRATITDTTGNFQFKSNDSNVTAVASAAGYTSKNIVLHKDQQPTIEMKKANANDEVGLLTEEETRRQKEKVSYSKELSGKVAGVDVTANRSAPHLKNDQFNKYIEENRVSIYDKNGKQFTGEVSLSFRINKKGRPVNIKIIASSCKECEEQATRLLENGPDWKLLQTKSGTVTIKF